MQFHCAETKLFQVQNRSLGEKYINSGVKFAKKQCKKFVHTKGGLIARTRTVHIFISGHVTMLQPKEHQYHFYKFFDFNEKDIWDHSQMNDVFS